MKNTSVFNNFTNKKIVVIAKRINNKNMETESFLLKKYEELFDCLPPKLMMISYNNEIYQKLMEKAIKRNRMLSDREITYAFRNVGRDIVK